MHRNGLAASEMSDHSHIGYRTRSVSAWRQNRVCMLRYVSMSIRLWNLDYSARWVEHSVWDVSVESSACGCDFVSNEEERTRTGLAPLIETMQKRLVSLFLHVGWEIRSGKSSSIDIGWCPGWRPIPSQSWYVIKNCRLRNTWMQHSTVDTRKCPRTAFVDAIDRGHTHWRRTSCWASSAKLLNSRLASSKWFSTWIKHCWCCKILITYLLH